MYANQDGGNKLIILNFLVKVGVLYPFQSHPFQVHSFTTWSLKPLDILLDANVLLKAKMKRPTAYKEHNGKKETVNIKTSKIYSHC